MTNLRWIVSGIHRLNPYFARSSNDRLAVATFIFGTHLSVWYEMCIVLPHYNLSSDYAVYAHYATTAILYFNSLANLFMVIVARPDGDCKALQRNQQTEWEYCARCRVNKPPRSHHCKVCDVCVLKRDHHCWFAGCCVGLRNHRHFVVMLTFLWLAAIYGNLLHWTYVGDQLGGYGPSTWFCVIAPHVALISGRITAYQFFVAVMTFVALLCVILFSWLLQMQVAQIYHGQTKHERKTGVTKYDLGWRENVRHALGSRWYLVWLSPWLSSPVPEDGYKYGTSAKTD